jgi:Holliday junction resolvasome RuvABC endonuclease subunit
MDGEKLVHVEAFRAAPVGSPHADVFHGYRNWLRAMLVAHDVKHAAIEQPLPTNMSFKRPDGSEETFSNMNTFLVLYGLRAHTLEICRALNIPCEEVHQGTWRKSFLGNGRADKKAAMDQCKQLRWKVPNQDAAEACGVAWWLNGHLSQLKMFAGAA